mgnify:CR=1 FL=1
MGSGLLRSSAFGLSCAVLLSASSMLSAKPTWAPGSADVIMSPGITAATCSAQKRDHLGNPVSAANAYVFGMLDLRTPTASNYTTLNSSSTMWNAPCWHHSSWSAKEMGCVFGIATDAQGNTYTAANGLWAPFYSTGFFGDPYLIYGDIGRAGSDEIGASGTIYQVDGLTGQASVFARVPQVSDPGLPIVPVVGTTNGGPGIGNITIDSSSGNLYATSLDDGKIYQFDSSGTLLGDFDPFVVETTPAPGMPPLGERLWAIEAHSGKLYFSVWNGGTVTTQNEIWSVVIPGGLINGASLTLEMTVPASYGASSFKSVVVSDLSFSADGNTMLIGERCIIENYKPNNHTTTARRAQFISGSWVMNGEVATGNSVIDGEAYGGVEFGLENGAAEQVVWMSSGDIATSSGPHGLQGMRMTDFPAPSGPPNKVPQSYVVPYVPGSGPSGPDFKGMGGDVETMKTGDCARVVVEKVHCPTEDGGPFTVTLNITNLQSKPAAFYGVVPTPSGSLPTGATSIQPTPIGWLPFSSVLSQGDSETVTLNLPGLSGGEFVCFNLTLLDEKFEECCTDTVCVDIPECECALVQDLKVVCRQLADGTWVYDLSITLENTSHLIGAPVTAYGISFGPNVTAFSPNYIDLSGSPLNPGDIQTLNTTYTGPSGTLCFKIALHDEGNIECCFLDEICIELPPCGGEPSGPDCCILTPELTYCCPLKGDGLLASEGARILYTVCNKSMEDRTYEWSIEGLGPGSISFAQEDPLTGVVTPVTGGTIGPIPPGECQTIEIIIICDMDYGECADYAITTSAGPGTPPLVCRGKICRPTPDEIIIKPDDEDPASALVPGEVRAKGYTVFNPTDADVDVPIGFASSYGMIGISSEPGAPGESAFETMLNVPAKTEVPLTIYITRLDDGRIIPANFVRLRSRVGALTDDNGDAHVSIVEVAAEPALPFRVTDVGSGNEEMVQLDLFLQFGPMEMRVEQFDLVSKTWQPVDVGIRDDVLSTKGSVVLGAGAQVLYTPRLGQDRGIFRVICIE